jgi:8-oxo-dGTP diphosphatase
MLTRCIVGKTSRKEPTVRTGVGVIVCKAHKVLVGKRLGSHGEGLYCFPGGHIEAKDGLKKHPLGGLGACGEREVEEETGMICRVISPDHYRADLFTTFDILSDDGMKVYLTSYLLAEYVHGGLELSDGTVVGREPAKCKSWHWVELDELVRLVNSEEQRAWIPIHSVLFYLKQLWRLS